MSHLNKMMLLSVLSQPTFPTPGHVCKEYKAWSFINWWHKPKVEDTRYLSAWHWYTCFLKDCHLKFIHFCLNSWSINDIWWGKDTVIGCPKEVKTLCAYKAHPGYMWPLKYSYYLYNLSKVSDWSSSLRKGVGFYNLVKGNYSKFDLKVTSRSFEIKSFAN